MELEIAGSIFRTALIQILLLAAPVLIVSLVVGLLLSIFQATTNLQEQTITFVPKLLAIFFTLIYCSSWMFKILANYTEQIFQTISKLNG